MKIGLKLFEIMPNFVIKVSFRNCDFKSRKCIFIRLSGIVRNLNKLIKFDINSPNYQNDLEFFSKVAQNVFNPWSKFNFEIVILRVEKAVLLG